jgi:hypothetical protein
MFNLRSIKSCAGFVALAFLIGGCSKESQLVSHIPAGGGLQSLALTSSAFKADQMIPKEFTADGQNISPPLKWTMGPPQTQSYVLFVEDPDAPGKNLFVHWIVYGLPANVTSLPQGASSAMGGGSPVSGMIQGANSKGLNSYTGAEPPPGKMHRYFFELFALNKAINLPAGASKQQVVTAMNGHVLTKAVLVGTYKR